MDEVRQRAQAYLNDHRVMTLATSGSGGVWAAAVFYVNEVFDLYFLSAPNTRHARDIAERPRVAATIQEDYRDWPDIKGIQMEGDAFQLGGRAQRQAMALYLVKYPFLATAGVVIRGALARVSWYQLKPSRLYFIDNSQGFGHRDEIRL